MGEVLLCFQLSMRQVCSMCSLLIHPGFVFIFFGDFHRIKDVRAEIYPRSDFFQTFAVLR